MNMKNKNENNTSTNEDSQIAENMSKIKHTIVIMSGKGGVGKSTVATNLAFALSMRGAQVGLLDVDIHGPNIPKMLNIESETVSGDGKGIFPVIVSPNLKVMSMGFLLSGRDAAIIWRGPVKMGVIKQFLGEVYWGDLDYLIIDLPPGTGDEPLSIAQLIPDCDGTLIVTTPQEVALLDSRKAVTFARTLNIPVIGIVENMSGFVCPHCNRSTDLFKVGGGEKAAREIDVPFLGRIPLDPEIVQTGDSGKPFIGIHNGSESEKAFNDLVNKIEEYVDLKKVK
jgi:Mrp family chromosome partitioning ATPase